MEVDDKSWTLNFPTEKYIVERDIDSYSSLLVYFFTINSLQLKCILSSTEKWFVNYCFLKGDGNDGRDNDEDGERE